MKRVTRPGEMIRNVSVLVLTFLWIIPTYLIVVNAMTPVTLYTGAPVWWPRGFALFENIAQGWEAGGFQSSFWNSILYAVLGASASVIIASAAAFAMVVVEVRNPRVLFWVVYSGTLLPLQVFAVPLYIASAQLGLYDTKTLLIIVYIAICIPFAFFVTRNFIVTLPPEIAQAAKLDGAGWWRMFYSIFVPLMRPAMIAAFVFQFGWIWNELFFGISLTITDENQPVMASLASLQTTYSSLSLPAVLATAIAVSLPALAVFFIFQRFFVAGLANNL